MKPPPETVESRSTSRRRLRFASPWRTPRANVELRMPPPESASPTVRGGSLAGSRSSSASISRLARLRRSRIAAANVHEHTLIFEADVFAGDIEQIRELIGEIAAALGTDPRWNNGTVNLAYRTEPLSDALVTGQEERALAGARIRFSITFRTPAFNATSVYP